MLFMKLNKKIRDLIKMIKQLRFYSDISGKSELTNVSLEDLQRGVSLPTGLKRMRIKTFPGTKMILEQQPVQETKNIIEIVIDHTGIYSIDEDLNIISLSVDLSIIAQAKNDEALFMDLINNLSDELLQNISLEQTDVSSIILSMEKEELEKIFSQEQINIIYNYKNILFKIIDFYIIIDMYF